MTAPEYAYYKDIYHGTMGEADYLRLSRPAWAYLEQATMGRAGGDLPPPLADKVKNACCAVADAYALNERGGGIASETNDGITVNYVAGVSTAKSDGQRLYDAAALYLGMTGLLYRGCP